MPHVTAAYLWELEEEKLLQQSRYSLMASRLVDVRRLVDYFEADPATLISGQEAATRMRFALMELKEDILADEVLGGF